MQTIPHIQHVPIETHVAIALAGEDGKVKLWGSSQSPFAQRSLIAKSLGLSTSDIQVIAPYVGGGFGCKAGVSMEALAVAIAMQVKGRPVKLRLTREEEFYTAFVRQGLVAHFKMGCDQNGRLLAMENRFYWDGGAYTEYGVNITRASGYSSSGPYDVPNVKTDSYCIYTNHPVLSDFAILARLGEEGVVCLLSDSTRAENPGYTPSERTVGEAFREIMEPLDGRVIVATFASNIARLQQVLDAAATFDRRVAVVGRSMEQNFRIASDLGYLTYTPSRILPRDQIGQAPSDQVVIATTGAQGEPMAGLARMANRDDRYVEIQPGDTVIVSASPIPGNEEYVARTIDNLFKAGANVIYHSIRHAHVSGHASQEELKLMLGLTKPRYFIPMHGEFRMQMVQHGRLAIETGVKPENVFIIENGTPIEIFADGSARRGQPVPAGYVYVDGLSVGEVGDGAS